MHSARAILAALVVPLSMTAQAEDWPDSLYTASDRVCADRICSRWWSDRAAESRCLDRYDEMVAEQLANPYRNAEVAAEDRSCAGEESDRCIDPEAIAIGRLAGIYAALSELRAAAEMRLPATVAPRELRVLWERLAWCYDHYQPALGAASYQDVLRCYDPRATKGIGEPDPPAYHVLTRALEPAVRATRLFGRGSASHGLCPERTPYASE
jgi:hypothetical protein